MSGCCGRGCLSAANANIANRPRKSCFGNVASNASPVAFRLECGGRKEEREEEGERTLEGARRRRLPSSLPLHRGSSAHDVCMLLDVIPESCQKKLEIKLLFKCHKFIMPNFTEVIYALPPPFLSLSVLNRHH